jgi:hypothetical protein
MNEERRVYRRYHWEHVPERWNDRLPDLSRTPFINATFQAPLSDWCMFISPLLQKRYEKKRKAWRDSHERHEYQST